MKKWKRIEPTIVSKIGYRTIISKTFETPDEKIHHFQTINNENFEASAVLALTNENNVIVARQFRVGPETVMDELPGCGVDENEDMESAVRRELLEETGYEAGTVEYLGAMRYDAYTNGERHCFLATGCKPSKKGANHGEHEFIELRLITIDQLIKNAKQGKLTDPGAVLLAYDKLLELKKEAKNV